MSLPRRDRRNPFGGPQNFGEAYQDFSYTVGKHELRFGGAIEYLRDNRSYGAYNRAYQIFGNTVGSALTISWPVSFMNTKPPSTRRASFPASTESQTPACTINLPVGPPDFERSNRYHEGAVYFQDSWKFSRRLTFNLGLRWEYFGVQHNVNANLDSNFYPASGVPCSESICSH